MLEYGAESDVRIRTIAFDGRRGSDGKWSLQVSGLGESDVRYLNHLGEEVRGDGGERRSKVLGRAGYAKSEEEAIRWAITWLTKMVIEKRKEG